MQPLLSSTSQDTENKSYPRHSNVDLQPFFFWTRSKFQNNRDFSSMIVSRSSDFPFEWLHSWVTKWKSPESHNLMKCRYPFWSSLLLWSFVTILMSQQLFFKWNLWIYRHNTYSSPLDTNIITVNYAPETSCYCLLPLATLIV